MSWRGRIGDLELAELFEVARAPTSVGSARANLWLYSAIVMPKGPNESASKLIRITVSDQSRALLQELARRGIYGRNVADVAGRFVDGALQRLVESEQIDLPRAKVLPRKRT